LFSIFQLSSTDFAFLGLNTVGQGSQTQIALRAKLWCWHSSSSTWTN